MRASFTNQLVANETAEIAFDNQIFFHRFELVFKFIHEPWPELVYVHLF